MKSLVAALAMFTLALSACSPGEGVCGQTGGPCADEESCVIGQCTATGRALWVLGRISVPVPQDGGRVVDGFDLDMHVSTADDPEGCNFADRTSPDGVPGIDNEFGASARTIDSLIPILDLPGISSLQDLFDRSIARRDILLAVLAEPSGSGRVNVSIYEVNTANDEDPLVEDGIMVANQEFVLIEPPMLVASNVEMTSGEIQLGPFESHIVLLGAVRVPLYDALLRMNVADRAGEGLTGGTSDPQALIEARSEIAPLIRYDLRQPGSELCDGMSMAFHFEAVPGILVD